MISISTTSGLCVLTAWMPYTPSPASATICRFGCFSRMLRIVPRYSGLSSIRTIRIGLAVKRIVLRKWLFYRQAITNYGRHPWGEDCICRVWSGRAVRANPSGRNRIRCHAREQGVFRCGDRFTGFSSLYPFDVQGNSSLLTGLDLVLDFLYSCPLMLYMSELKRLRFPISAVGNCLQRSALCRICGTQKTFPPLPPVWL